MTDYKGILQDVLQQFHCPETIPSSPLFCDDAVVWYNGYQASGGDAIQQVREEISKSISGSADYEICIHRCDCQNIAEDTIQILAEYDLCIGNEGSGAGERILINITFAREQIRSFQAGRLDTGAVTRKYGVYCNGCWYYLDEPDVVCLEASRNYHVWYCIEGKEYKERGPLRPIMDELSAAFVMVGSHHIINVIHIEKIVRHEIHLPAVQKIITIPQGQIRETKRDISRANRTASIR